MGDKPVSELISADTMITASGAVTGTLHYVKGWKAFSDDPEQQNGYYFPLKLDEKYSGKEITCAGTITKKAEDLEWILLVKDQQSKFTFSTDADGTFLTLTFAGVTLGEKGD